MLPKLSLQVFELSKCTKVRSSYYSKKENPSWWVERVVRTECWSSKASWHHQRNTKGEECHHRAALESLFKAFNNNDMQGNHQEPKLFSQLFSNISNMRKPIRRKKNHFFFRHPLLHTNLFYLGDEFPICGCSCSPWRDLTAWKNVGPKKYSVAIKLSFLVLLFLSQLSTFQLNNIALVSNYLGKML